MGSKSPPLPPTSPDPRPPLPTALPPASVGDHLTRSLWGPAPPVCHVAASLPPPPPPCLRPTPVSPSLGLGPTGLALTDGSSMPLSSPHAWGSGSWGGLAFPGASGAGGRATGPRGAKDLVLGAVVQPPNREVGVRVQGPGDCPTHSSSARHSHTHSELGRRTLHRLPDAPSEGGLPQNAPLHFHALRPQARLAFSSCSLRLLQGGPSPHLLGCAPLSALNPSGCAQRPVGPLRVGLHVLAPSDLEHPMARSGQGLWVWEPQGGGQTLARGSLSPPPSAGGQHRPLRTAGFACSFLCGLT